MTTRHVQALGAVLGLAFALSCAKSENAPRAAPAGATDSKTETRMSAAQIIEEFKSAGLPIGVVIFYTEENDPNSLLGRPGQYVEKARWEDKRVKQIPDSRGEIDPEGGGLEVFNNLQELERRKAYLEQPIPIGPPLVEYRYIVGTALIRLDKYLTPRQAADYEAVVIRLRERHGPQSQ